MGAFSTTTNPPPVIDGFTLKLKGGALSAGDSFKITPTRNAAANIQTEMTDSKRLAIAAPLGAAIAPGGSGTLTIPASGQPTLTTKFDIYDPTTTTAMQNGMKYSTPVKVVFGDPSADGTSQGYQLLDAKGGVLSSGTIKPGQTNTLSLSIPLEDCDRCGDSTGARHSVHRQFRHDRCRFARQGHGGQRHPQPAGHVWTTATAVSLADLQTKQTVDTGSASKGISA